MFQLRPYQAEMIEKAREIFRTSGVTVLTNGSARRASLIMCAPTGAGKTALAAHMLYEAAEKEMLCYFTVHRRELIKQTSLAFEEQGIEHGIIASGFPDDMGQKIQICSIDTLKARLSQIPNPDFVIWDECHHMPAAGWLKVKEEFQSAWSIGLTATPERLDGKGLKDLFDKIIMGPTLRWLINNGYLSDYKYYAPFVPDVSKVKKKAGDYKASEAEAVMNLAAVNGNIVHHYQVHAAGMQAVLFGITIQHCVDMVSAFNAHGINAGILHSKMKTKERDAVIESFKNREINILANVGIITEGFDLPAIEAVIMARPTQSTSLYLQMVGRALRFVEGKTAVILDHAGNVYRHGMPDMERIWSLDGRNKKDQEPRVKTLEDGTIATAPPEPINEDEARFLEEMNKEKIERANKRRRTAEFIAAKTYEQLVDLGKARGYKAHYWAPRVLESRRGKYLTEEEYQVEMAKHHEWLKRNGRK